MLRICATPSASHTTVPGEGNTSADTWSVYRIVIFFKKICVFPAINSTLWSINPENQLFVFCSSATFGFSFGVLVNSNAASKRSFNFCSRSSLNISINPLTSLVYIPTFTSVRVKRRPPLESRCHGSNTSNVLISDSVISRGRPSWSRTPSSRCRSWKTSLPSYVDASTADLSTFLM